MCTSDGVPPMGPCMAIVTILKGMIGAGILALPKIFGDIRLAFAIPGYLVATALCAFAVWRLIQCKVLLESAAETRSAGEVSKAGRGANGHGLGPMAVVAAQAFGRPGLLLTGCSIIASQLGICVAYTQVVVETMSLPGLFQGVLTTAQLRISVCALLCLVMLVRKLDSIAKLSGAALLIYAYLLGALVFFGGEQLRDGPDMAERPVWLPVGWSSFGSWFGTAIFAQQAIVVSSFIYDGMQLTAADSRRFLPILAWSFGLSGLLSTFVGGFGYLAYVDDVRDVFYLNFPQEQTRPAEVILCVVLMLSFVLQMYPVTTCGEAYLASLCSGAADAYGPIDSDGSQGGSLGGLPSVVFRFTLVIFCSLVCVFVPNLTCITGLSGALAMSLFGFFLPALCHVKLRKYRLSACEWIQNLMLLCAGTAAVVFGVSGTSC